MKRHIYTILLVVSAVIFTSCGSRGNRPVSAVGCSDTPSEIGHSNVTSSSPISHSPRHYFRSLPSRNSLSRRDSTIHVSQSLAELSRRTAKKYFACQSSDTLKVGRAQLSVPSGSMSRDRILSITPLKKSELPLLPSGMVNVTGNCDTLMANTDTTAGYRFLPHGNHFIHSLASISVPYDSTLIPKGYTSSDIHTYYYDEMHRRWAMLQQKGIDTKNELAIAETSHFTDVINGIIKVPESPETQNYVPTGISDLKAADPSAGITQIEMPSANQNGTATLSYPFETPGGRGGIQASAGLQYSSDGNSSYVGYGWNMPVQSIDIETRWGVPRFDAAIESESYLFMGEQLNNRIYRTADQISRQANRQFFPMVEGSFSKIVRKGSSTKNYSWEVTDKGGTKSYFGGTEESVLKDADGNIIRWALRRIEDVHGNFAAFHYMKSGNNLYPLRYTYTGFGTEEGTYSIEFRIDSAGRKDVIRNGRLGILQTDNALLTKVSIKNRGVLIRAYDFNYEEGVFGKTMLKSIDQKDCEDKTVATQTFNYYNDVENGMFSEAEKWSVSKDSKDGYHKFLNHLVDGCNDNLSMLGGGYSSGKTVGGGLMVGFGVGIYSMNVGASYTHVSNNSDGEIAFVDIDGDGLPDKIFRTILGLRYRKNMFGET